GAGVRNEPANRLLLRVEDLQELVGVTGERSEVAQRVVDVLPAAPDAERLLLHPRLEREAGLGVERTEDLVELHRRRDLRDRQVAALRDRAELLVAGRELD